MENLFPSLLIVIFTLIYILYRKFFYYWDGLGITQFPISNFMKGNLDEVGIKYHMSHLLMKYYEKTKELGKSCCGLYLSANRVLLICDLHLAQRVLIKDFEFFVNRGFYSNPRDEPISGHLLNLEDERWRLMRNKMSPLFTSGKLRFMFHTIEEVADKMLNKLDKLSNNSLDIRELIEMYAADTMGSIGFGIDTQSLDSQNAKFREINALIFSNKRSQIFRMFKYAFKDLSRKLHIRSLPAHVNDFYLNFAKETVAFREQNPSFVRKDFVQLMVELKKQNLITIEQISAQIFVFFVAG